MTMKTERALQFACALAMLLVGSMGRATADDAAAVTLPRIPPLEPAAALESFALRDGFTLQLLATEPLVTDPVAGAYDENGRLFIVEMNDYPFTDKTTDKPNQERTADLPIGKVRLLEDLDDDGVFDSSTIFARDLSWPTGIAIFDGGVFVAATPDVWYLKDTDGDNVADIRRKVFTGFRKFNVQAVMNNLVWGLDHRIYGAGGTNGGTITSPNDKQIVITRNDFRFDPRRPELELLSGGARFGNCFDDEGHRFICNIRNPIQHVLLPQHYLTRNPLLPVSSVVHDVAAAGDQIRVYRSSPPEPWRVVNAARLMSQGDPRMPRSEKNAAGFMTSACGVTIYRGDAYPAEFREQAFLAEPSGNLVHRQQLARTGVTFTSQRIDAESEFLASVDNWFRPVNFISAPDGTLHLCDMYRETIEHPWSMPDDLKAMLDLESGRDRGRLYRVAPPNFVRRPTPKLGSASITELVALLEHPNVWHRDTAIRLLFERQDQSATELLRDLRSRTQHPVARLHILWSLHGLDTLTVSDLTIALRDEAASVRAQAVLLAEEWLLQGDVPELRERIVALADDAEPAVRFQVAFTLGSIAEPRRAAALEAIARRDADDPWIIAAVLSSAAELAPAMLTTLLADQEFVADARRLPLLRQLAQIAGARNQPEELVSLGEMLAAFPEKATAVQTQLVLALSDGLRRSGKRLDDAWRISPQATTLLHNQLQAARQTVLNADVDLAVRLQALPLLACGSFSEIEESLWSLLDLRQPQELQIAAIRTLAGYHSDDLAARLLAGFPGSTPLVQYEIIEALANHPRRLPVLLDALAEQRIAAAQITPIRKMLLLNHADDAIRQRAAKLIGNERATPRQAVIRDYQPALEMQGDAARGGKIFQRECLTCHRAGTVGHDVGPNLATVRHRRADEILTAILDPNREVGPNFMQFAVALDDGQVLTGMIAEESAVSLTLKRAENKQDIVLRQNIAEIAGTGLSLMPEGLEKKITVEEMIDLLAFLRGK